MPEKYQHSINICVQYVKEVAGVLEDAGVLPNLLGTKENAKHWWWDADIVKQNVQFAPTSL